MPRWASALHRRAFLLWARTRVRPGRLGALGAGSVILPPARIQCPERIELGARVVIFERCTFSLVTEHWGGRYEPRVRIGDGTIVGHNAWFSCVGEIAIGRDVLIGHDVLIADSYHGHRDRGTPILRQPMLTPNPVRIEDGAHIGPGASVLSGVTVGAGAYLLPGAVLSDDLPAHCVGAGNPAEVISRWDATRDAWVPTEDPRWASVLDALGRPAGSGASPGSGPP